ncbi:MAG: DUF4093 domain-containing protein [Clostridia bacterium]|nr:DUF4093 domain-containing protein [Clostridia bacterium]
MKPTIKYPIIVEGKYDKIKLDSLVCANVITTGGFAIFNGDERLKLIKKLAKDSKVILLTDSDGAGHLIRSHIKTALSPEQIINLYIPQVGGKEKRKREASKEGFLGVEGTDSKKILELLAPYLEGANEKPRGEVSKVDFYKYGLSGTNNASKRREELLKKLDLPVNMSSNAMLSAINILYSKEEFEKIMEQ